MPTTECACWSKVPLAQPTCCGEPVQQVEEILLRSTRWRRLVRTAGIVQSPGTARRRTQSDAASHGNKVRAERGLYTIGKGRRSPVLQPARCRLRKHQGPVTETSLQGGHD